MYWIIFVVRNTLLVKWGDWTPFYLASGFESRGPTMNYMLCPPCPISCDCAQNKTRHWGLKRGFLLCRVRLPLLLYKCAHYNFPFPSGDIFSVPTHIVRHTKRDLRMCVLWMSGNRLMQFWMVLTHIGQWASIPTKPRLVQCYRRCKFSFPSGETVKRA